MCESALTVRGARDPALPCLPPHKKVQGAATDGPHPSNLPALLGVYFHPDNDRDDHLFGVCLFLSQLVRSDAVSVLVAEQRAERLNELVRNLIHRRPSAMTADCRSTLKNREEETSRRI